MKTREEVFGLLSWLLLAFAAETIGAIASIEARAFYGSLRQPAWAPPGWVFGPVWTTLYMLMGIASWLVWREREHGGRQTALALYVVQLAVNTLWSWLFFAWHLGAAAFADIILLLALLVATIALFRRVRPLAAALLLPYLCWVVFATALCGAVWRMNPVALG
ncbi:TspO/MBR family protein [Noviherbaspirillum pedocola]|uniref:Tryptophan-rich sensory protein n=1 Tax=Noviherbaspirillum pedocola TaxID=2801341 RepID=A0A934STT0_9BURK|nr:TspO/MBR family protein [Noviherbaspirillum pedocola]MBK4735547.1 tryptophan-rich sensory protein [Noviherbaspirillum pedocola]